MTGLLQRIVSSKREEITTLRGRRLPTPGKLIPADLARRPGDPLRLIAEIKRRSPSAGALSTVLSVADRALSYQRAGAHMVSVLCDAAFFDGSFEHLAEARAACDLPLLCKDFVLDEVQLDAARAYGASAVLLIVRCLGDTELERLILGARARELLPIVEITTREEAERALGAGADCIGVNARDLDTLEMDSERAATVLRDLPAELTRCWFSGLKEPTALADPIYRAVDAALLGEGLMRQDDPGPLLRRFVQAAQHGLP
jgi:indole-3-glycerol phosphate synthase